MTYVDLQVTTNYSFLRGASFPRELVVAAVTLGHETVSITDRNTLAGIVKAYDAVKTYNKQENAQIKLVTGCRLDLISGESLLCYPQDRAAYGTAVMESLVNWAFVADNLDGRGLARADQPAKAPLPLPKGQA